MKSGIYRFPAINGNTVVFVCEDDLWSAPASGGRAIRLTAGVSDCSRPILSPDGSRVAFTAKFEGAPEIYCMDAEGGEAKRLTFLGANTQTAGWTPDGSRIILSTNARQPFLKIRKLYTVSPDGGEITELPYGIANNISYSANGGVVIGRNTADPATWKRYRGGTAGVLWIDPNGSGEFKRLCAHLRGNFACPMWIDDRIYFISDHDGIGNIYSCTPAGDLRRETSHGEFFARNATSDGRSIVYHAGGDIYLLDPSRGIHTKIVIEFSSHRPQSQRRFTDSSEFLEECYLNPMGHYTAITTRGRTFVMGNWDGPVQQIGAPDGVRYRLTRWLPDGERIITISDEGGEEQTEIYNAKTGERLQRFDAAWYGRPTDLEPNPKLPVVAIANNRFELFVQNCETGQTTFVARSKFSGISGMAWSPDGVWLAFSFAHTAQTCSLRLYSTETGEIQEVTEPSFRDFSPSFDPEGKYLYFLSFREFNPVYDAMYFDLNFPRGMRPYLVTLQHDTPSPFIGIPKPPELEKTSKTEAESEETTQSDTPEVRIDFEGISRRVIAFPVPEGKYSHIVGAKGKVLFSSTPMKGSLEDSESSADGIIELYDFAQQKKETVATGINSFELAGKAPLLIYRAGKRLRVLPAAPMQPEKPADDRPSKKSGWLDLSRIKVSVIPTLEWRQMFRELWRLQRDHYWTPDMAGIDWEAIYERYLPVLERCATRLEFSDLVWEVHGELGTSHAYERGGDFRRSPDYRQGFLGADFRYDETTDGYRINRIIRGDSWVEQANSSLARPGVTINEGDILIAVNGRKAGKLVTPGELLVNLAGNEARLTMQTPGAEARSVNVKVLSDESSSRYRNWVETNKQLVHEATGGKIGYVHLPNMGPLGYSEFHRYYFREVERDGLIVDVRFNGGGHVSQLILEKLARQRIAYTVKRWGEPNPYPQSSILGPIIALTNEYAGSDGDIFSHCFKLMKLGKLVGKRTWGGVVGISPRHRLVDGTVTTQPEFSFWFVDVGWNVENYGTDPDIEVEIAPQDYREGADPQLQKCIELIMADLEANPVSLPDFGNRPRLAHP